MKGNVRPPTQFANPATATPEQVVPAQGPSQNPPKGTGTVAGQAPSPDTIDSFLNALALQPSRDAAEALFVKFRNAYGPRLNEKQFNLIINTFNRIIDKFERYKGPDASRSS
jgi:hypothetical protein